MNSEEKDTKRSLPYMNVNPLDATEFKKSLFTLFINLSRYLL